MKKILLATFSLLIIYPVFAQSKKDTVICICKGIQVASTRSSIEGYPFNKTLSISKNFFRHGFTLISSDPGWKVDGFWYYYECEGFDIYAKQVLGNTVNVDEHFIFKKLKKGEVLDFTCVNLERNGKRYIAQGFSVLVTD